MSKQQDKTQEALSEPPPYEVFDKNEIVTNDIYFSVKENERRLDRSLVIEFRTRLESFLFGKRFVDVKFHPINWQYHRDKFLLEQDIDWTDSDYNTIFYPDFFLQDSRFTGEVAFDSLTDDEKIQIVVPKPLSAQNSFGPIFGRSEEQIQQREQTKQKNESEEDDSDDFEFENMAKIFGMSEEQVRELEEPEEEEKENFDNLSPERRHEILGKLNDPKYRSQFRDNEDPYQWYRWEYDIYSLDLPCKVDFKEDSRDDYDFFFAWKLSFIDLYDVKLFLDWHLRNTFDNNDGSFKDFASLLLMKYDRILNNPHLVKLVNQFMDNVQKTTENNVATPPVSNEKSVAIPLKLSGRAKGDNLTVLTREQTVILFKLLQETDIIFKNELLSNLSLASSILVLTGYKGNTIKDLANLTWNKYDLQYVKSELKKVISLIDSKLK